MKLFMYGLMSVLSIIFLVFVIGIIMYLLGPTVDRITGWGRDIDIKIISNKNISNVKEITLKVKNNSSAIWDYTAASSNLNISTDDFYITDDNGNVLEIDGRTKDVERKLIRNGSRQIKLTFVDSEDQIDNYSSIVFEKGKVQKRIGLPKPEVVKSDIELLGEALLSNDKSSKEAAAQEIRARVTSSIPFSEESHREQNIFSYNGSWGDKNSFKEGGTSLELQTINESTANMELFVVQEPPSNRIASIYTTLNFDDNGVATFIFQDDGWGSSGEGSVTLEENDTITVLIKYSTIAEDAMWSLFDGKVNYTPNMAISK
jgi:hypothetical protein